MSSLAERLKALGVRVGVDKRETPKRSARHPIERVMDGEIRETPFGETYVVERVYPHDYQHGQAQLGLGAPLEMVADWAKDERIAACEPSRFAFLDTETSGLAGGAGTYVFLVGVGRYEPEGFRLMQLFMRDPIEEPALLAALEAFMAPCETIVTFNGKAFDLPLLNTRFLANGSKPSFDDLAHLDVLHLARRIWRDRLPSRTLGYLEEHVLGEQRDEEDVPGWMIPQMYFDYLRDGDARPLRGVFYHNAMDVMTLASLTDYLAAMLADPLDGPVQHGEDLAAIGRLLQDLGHWERAASVLERSLTLDLPNNLKASTVERLSHLHRRRGDLEAALSLWMQAAAERHIYAHVEIAKHYEHRVGDFAEALRWTRAALAILETEGTPRYKRIQWESPLEHRLNRLQRRLSNQSGTSKSVT